MELLESLPTLLKSFWYIAIPTSLIFLIQTIITTLSPRATPFNKNRNTLCDGHGLRVLATDDRSPPATNSPPAVTNNHEPATDFSSNTFNTRLITDDFAGMRDSAPPST